MVRVIIAGGSGNVAREVIDHILAKANHELTVLTRQASPENLETKVSWATVDYEDKNSLVRAFHGAHTVLSFLAIPDPTTAVRVQKNMVDAAIEAGVKRFAPSEWGSRSNSGIRLYGFKDEIHKYLEDVNKETKKLEYCLFQPGYFTNYFGYPFTTTKHFHMSPTYIDFENRRAILIGDGHYEISLTTVQDMAELVAEALDYQGEWPSAGEFCGSRITMAELVRLGENLLGPFTVDVVSPEDLDAGELKTSWYPMIEHPSIPPERRDEMAKVITLTFLQGVKSGGWCVSNVWNKLLPKLQFETAEHYLTNIWKDKP